MTSTRVLGVVVLLLAAGVPNLAGAASQQQPLIEAAKRGDAAAVRTLLQQKADPNAAEPDGTTALHWAAHINDGRTAELLIKAGANVKAANRYGATPFSLACLKGNA